MTYIPTSIRATDALSLKELCDPRFTLRNPFRPFAIFGGVIDTPDVNAVRKKENEARMPDRTCRFPGCKRPVLQKSRTKTCREHRHCPQCECLNCRKVLR